MKRIFFVLIVIFLLSGCKKQHEAIADKDWTAISGNVKMKQSADGLELMSGTHSYKIPNSKLPFKRVVFLNASLIGYLTELGAEDRIVGVSSPEYIYSEKIHQLITQGKIADVGNEQKYNIEKILALKPDAVFTNYISSFGNTYELIKKNNIEVIFLDEYLEQKPLEKAAYLKVFGNLFGMDKVSAVRFGEIASNYENLKKLASGAKEKPLVISNEMYGAQWFLPGGRTASAAFINDAGGNYILTGNQAEKAVPMSFEEVFSKSQNAKVWVNLGSHSSKKDLLNINPNYAKMDVWKNGNLYTVTGAEKDKANDFFESGVVRVDAVLKDYIKIFHPEVLPNHKLVYMKELK